MKSRIFTALAVCAMLALGIVTVGCGSDDDDNKDKGSGSGSGDVTLIKEGTLTVGSDIPFEPFEGGKPPGYEGFDIDVTNEIAKNLGYKVEYQDTAFDTIFRDLAQGKFDMVASATTITEKRQQQVDFSDPYYEAQQGLLVPTGSDVATTADLSGKTVGAQDGTTGETFANDETDAAQVRGFPTGADAINALRAGQVEAVILDEPVVQKAIEANPEGVELAEKIATDELYGLAFPQDSDALREKVNEELAKLKDDGKLQELYEKWFPGTTPPESVLDGTTEPAS